MTDDIIWDIGSAEDETNEFYHKWLDAKKERDRLREENEKLRLALEIIAGRRQCIMMCANGDCPSAETCYRHRATPGYWQSWGVNLAPDESGKCGYYTSAEGWGRLRPFPVAPDLTGEPHSRGTETGNG